MWLVCFAIDYELIFSCYFSFFCHRILVLVYQLFSNPERLAHYPKKGIKNHLYMFCFLNLHKNFDLKNTSNLNISCLRGSQVWEDIQIIMFCFKNIWFFIGYLPDLLIKINVLSLIKEAPLFVQLLLGWNRYGNGWTVQLWKLAKKALG